MSTPISDEKYFKDLATTNWKNYSVTQEGYPVEQSTSWAGRICSCLTRKGHSISDAQVEVISNARVAVQKRAITFMGEGKAIGEEEELRRFEIAKAGTDNLDILVAHVLKIRPDSKLEKINLKVKDDDSSSIKADIVPVAPGSPVEDVESSSGKADDSAVDDIDSSSGEADRVPAVSTPATEVVASADKGVEKPAGKRSRDQETLDRAEDYIRMFERNFKSRTGQ